jgi:hypothetical protein
MSSRILLNMEAPFVDHNHGNFFFFYRITYPIKIVNYSGWGVETREEELPRGDCALIVLKSAKCRAIKKQGSLMLLHLPEFILLLIAFYAPIVSG